LGDILAKEFRVGAHIDLDLCFNDFESKEDDGVVGFKSVEEGRKEYLKKIRGMDSWVVEGVFPVKEAFEEADKIILIKYWVLFPLFFQWKRFFTDKWQRDTYGVKSNLWLSGDILRQYFSRKDNDFENPLSFTVRKYNKLLKLYEGKSIRVNSPHDLNVLISNWKILSKN